MRSDWLIGGAILLFASALALQSCNRAPETAVAPAAAPPAAGGDMKAIVSVRELMQNIVDPLSDNVFEAVGSDVTAQGVVETKPTTDEDWAKVMQGAVVLAESSNLLKIPRPIAPKDDYVSKNPGELPPAEIEASINENRAAWNAYANAMRDEALKVVDIVKAKDTDRLLQAGSDIDRACESCHLAFWYPGDREAVLKDRNSKAFTEPVKK